MVVTCHGTRSSSFSLPLELTLDLSYLCHELATGIFEFPPPRLQLVLGDIRLRVWLLTRRRGIFRSIDRRSLRVGVLLYRDRYQLCHVALAGRVRAAVVAFRVGAHL